MNRHDNPPHESQPHPHPNQLLQRQFSGIVNATIELNNRIFGPDGLTLGPRDEQGFLLRDENNKPIEGDVEYLMRMSTSISPIPTADYPKYTRVPKHLRASITEAQAFALQYPELIPITDALRDTSGDKRRAAEALTASDSNIPYLEEKNARQILRAQHQKHADRLAVLGLVRQLHPQQQGEQGRQAPRRQSQMKRLARAIAAPLIHQFQNPYTTKIGHE